MNKKYKILSVILIMMLFITSNIPVAIVQASGIESRAIICDGVKIKSFYFDRNTTSVLATNGDLYSWGENKYGQVGNGTTDDQYTPVKILENVKAFYSDYSTCAATTINSLGYNR